MHVFRPVLPLRAVAVGVGVAGAGVAGAVVAAAAAALPCYCRVWYSMIYLRVFY